MACNPDKTEVDHLCSCFHSIILFLLLIDVGGYIRLPAPAAQDLRVLVDLHLILSKHVNSVCKSAFFSVSSIGRIGKYLDHDKCLTMPIVDVVEFRRVWDRVNPIPWNTTDKCSEHNPKIGPLTDLHTQWHSSYFSSMKRSSYNNWIRNVLEILWLSLILD